MSYKKKVFILFPDGVGLRNFGMTDFQKIGKEQGFEIVYWNNTNFSLKNSFGYDELKIENQNINKLTTIYTRVRKHIELNFWQRKFNDKVYATYKFPFFFSGIKATFRSLLTKILIELNNSEKGIIRVRQKIKNLEKKTSKYKYCKTQLEKHQPDFVFCTNQRASQAISAILAAQDLGIPTATFIYSWDNIPKAMKVVETDYYFVWSEYMKNELLYYYPYISANQVFITGTPQFEPHYDESIYLSKESFFNKYNLDLNKKYICFSGDDETTSPLDQYYLEDLAKAVISLNKKGYNLGILYRKCPVDFTSRYNQVLSKYSDVIVKLDPLWVQEGDSWNQVTPTKEDFKMLVNVCRHSEFVTNVCSSTVFDFVIHNKPCIYYNYEQPQLKPGIRDVGQNYNYVHFRSMPNSQAAIFCTDKNELEGQLEQVLNGGLSNVKDGLHWYKIIVGNQPNNASRNIWNSIKKITI